MILEDHTAQTRPWLWKPRSTLKRDGVAVSGWPPRIIELHATRGSARDYDTEYRGAINWSQSDNNRRVSAWGEVWGSSFTYVVNGPKVARILADEAMPTYSAGYGGADTWPVDFCAVSIEVCQMDVNVPIPHETRLTVAELCASLCREYTIPVRRLMLLDQTVWPPPSGLVEHKDTANGRILGKTDIGPEWVMNEFLWEVRQAIERQEEDMCDPARLQAIEKKVDGIAAEQTRTFRAIKDTLARDHVWIGGLVKGVPEATVEELEELVSHLQVVR